MPITLPADRHAAAGGLFPGVSTVVLGILDEVVFPGEMILGVETAKKFRVIVENWVEEDRFLDLDTRWYPGTKIDNATFTSDFQEFTLRYSAFETEETEAFFQLETANVEGAIRKNRARYAAFAGGFVRRSDEVDREELLTTTANWGTNFTDNSGTEWGAAGGDILADIDAQAITIRQNVGVGRRMLKLYLSPSVWDKAKQDVGFVAFRTTGGNITTSGFGTLDEMADYLSLPRGNVWTNETGIQIITSRGGTRVPVWNKDAILYTAWDLIPSSAEWGIPRLGVVFRNLGPGAAKPYFLPGEGRVWRFPWLGRERSFLLTNGAGHLFKDTVL
jgi:hypothetical protein